MAIVRHSSCMISCLMWETVQLPRYPNGPNFTDILVSAAKPKTSRISSISVLSQLPVNFCSETPELKMKQTSNSLITSPLGKVLWTIYAIILTSIKSLFWLIYYLPKPLRQHPKWTYHQAIANELMRAFLYHSSIMEVRTPLSLEPAGEKHFVSIPPQNSDFYRGVLAYPSIRPTTIGGIWYPNPYNPSADKGQNVVLYFHGGGFVIGEGRSAVTGFAASKLAKAFRNAKVLSFSYRLSSNPNSQFPAAVQDAVTAYKYLLDQRIDPQLIIFAGDSAGCTVAIALLRYIADNEPHLPPPLAAVLCSPWIDVYSARDPAFALRYCNVTTDYVPGELLAWGARTYIPEKVEDGANAYISPQNHPFRTRAFLWLCFGGLEILFDEGVNFAESMRSVGNRVEVHIEPYATHAILGIGNVTGFAVEAERAIGRAGETILKD